MIILLLLLIHAAHASTIAFVTSETFTGSDLGSRSQTSAYCASRGTDRFGCLGQATAYLRYYGSGDIDPLFVDNQTVYTFDGRQMGPNVTHMSLSLITQDVWIGNSTDLYGACEDWTTDGCFNGLVRLADGRLRLRGCGMRFPILCICTGGTFDATPGPTTLSPTSKSPTQSPTNQPTIRPTLFPTEMPTLHPTLSPTYVMYLSQLFLCLSLSLSHV